MNNYELFSLTDTRGTYINRPIPLINKDAVFNGVMITGNTPNQADFYTIKSEAVERLEIKQEKNDAS
jgi:hypothetical protein